MKAATTENQSLLKKTQEVITVKTIRRNLAVLCVVWAFTFTAYSALQNLEASLVPELGVYSLASITGGGLITCIFAPAVFNYIGCKSAFVISWLCFGVFVASNYYPKVYLLIPGSIVIGLATGLLWTAQGIFVTTSAMEYSKISGDPFEPLLTKFFGFFGMAFQSTQIWGNLISSVVLQTGGSNHTNVDSKCGAVDCPGSSGPSFNETSSPETKPGDITVYILISIYLGCVLIGLFITVVFLKPVKTPRGAATSNLKELLTSTVRLLFQDANMTMLVPFSLFLGVEQVVIYAEYTKSFVTCALGIDWVGYTMICFGVCDTLASPCVGYLCRYVGRGILFFCATILNLAVIVVLLLWEPSPSNMVVFFVVPGLWGLADSVWQTQGAAVVGAVFTDKQEPAFANLRMFQALGFTIAYLYSNQLCQYVKLYMIGGLLLLSVVLIGVVETKHSRTTKVVVYDIVYEK